jgi:chromosome segregation ATPase
LDGLNRTACQLAEERAAVLSRLRGSELAAEQWREKFDESLGRLADLAERQERINQTLAQLQRRSFVFLLLGDQLLQSLLACEELLEDREDAIVRLGSSLVALSEDYHRLLAQHQDLQRVLAVQTVESSLGSISPLRSVQLFLAGVTKGLLRLLWR